VVGLARLQGLVVDGNNYCVFVRTSELAHFLGTILVTACIG
jgi:hypothetical protein